MNDWRLAGFALACFGLAGCTGGLTKESQPTMTLSEAICEVQNALIETSRGQDEARAGMMLGKATVSLQLGVKDNAEVAVGGELVKGIVTWGPSAKRSKEATTGNTLTIEFVSAAGAAGNPIRFYSLGVPPRSMSAKDMNTLEDLLGRYGYEGIDESAATSIPLPAVQPKDCSQFALKKATKTSGSARASEAASP